MIGACLEAQEEVAVALWSNSYLLIGWSGLHVPGKTVIVSLGKTLNSSLPPIVPVMCKSL